MSEATLKRRMKNVYARAENAEHLHFAAGTAIAESGADVPAAMHLADERMYEDKRKYYKAHPDKIYR